MPAFIEEAPLSETDGNFNFFSPRLYPSEFAMRGRVFTKRFLQSVLSIPVEAPTGPAVFAPEEIRVSQE